MAAFRRDKVDAGLIFCFVQLLVSRNNNRSRVRIAHRPRNGSGGRRLGAEYASKLPCGNRDNRDSQHNQRKPKNPRITLILFLFSLLGAHAVKRSPLFNLRSALSAYFPSSKSRTSDRSALPHSVQARELPAFCARYSPHEKAPR